MWILQRATKNFLRQCKTFAASRKMKKKSIEVIEKKKVMKNEKSFEKVFDCYATLKEEFISVAMQDDD